MNLATRREVQRAVLAFCCCIPVPLIAALVYWDPSHTAPGNPFGASSLFLLFVVGNAVGIFLISWLLLKVNNRGHFEVMFAVSFFLLLAYGIALAIMVHRDFFTYVFQHILCFWLIFCRRLEGFANPKRWRITLAYMRTANLIVLAAVCVWLILMGYAVCTRAEPRWIESIFYNALISSSSLCLSS